MHSPRSCAEQITVTNTHEQIESSDWHFPRTAGAQRLAVHVTSREARDKPALDLLEIVCGQVRRCVARSAIAAVEDSKGHRSRLFRAARCRLSPNRSTTACHHARCTASRSRVHRGDRSCRCILRRFCPSPIRSASTARRLMQTDIGTTPELPLHPCGAIYCSSAPGASRNLFARFNRTTYRSTCQRSISGLNAPSVTLPLLITCLGYRVQGPPLPKEV